MTNDNETLLVLLLMLKLLISNELDIIINWDDSGIILA